MRAALVLMLCLASIDCQAQVMMNKHIACFPPFDVEKSLGNASYREQVLLKGIDSDNHTTVEWYENLETGTWTVIERNDKLVCILASGDKGKKS